MRTVASSLIRVFLVAILLCAVVHAHLNGPPPGHTGAPGEGTCADAGCHDAPFPGFVAKVNLNRSNQGSPDTQLFTITVNDYHSAPPYATNWGFQVTFLDTLGNAAGTPVVIDTAGTQLVSGGTGRMYMMHTTAGAPSLHNPNSRSWTVGWMPPDDTSCPPPPVLAYATGVKGDGDGSAAGDLGPSHVDWVRDGCPIVVPGDVNSSGAVTSADIIKMFYIFKPGKGLPQPCEANGDVNCDGKNTSSDIIYLVNFVFKGTGPPPCDICELICQGVWSCF